MADTVFDPSFGNRPARLVGRERIIDEYMRGLESRPGNRDRAVLVLGQRGMGKTALLLEIADRARLRDYVTVRVDAGPGMLDEIIELLQIEGARYVGSGKSKVKGFNAGALEFSLGLTFTDEVGANYGFRVKLSLLCDRLAECGKGVLLLVDEVRGKSDEMRQLASTYQHLVGDGKNVAIAMAGLPGAVSRVLNDEVITFLNRARKIRLCPIEVRAVREYYSSEFERLGKTFEPGMLDEAVKATRGFPYLMQLIGYWLVRYTEGEGSIDQETIEQAVDSSLCDLVEDVYYPVLSVLSDKDRAFLMAMSEDEGASKIADIRARMGVSEGYVQPYRSRLLEAGVIEAVRRGEVRFAIPYLGDYLAGKFDVISWDV